MKVLSDIPFVTQQAIDAELMKKKLVYDSFYYNCSHCIRSPLSTLEGLIELVKHQQEMAPDDSKSLVRCIKATGDAVRGLYDAFTELHTNNDRYVKIETVDLDTLVKECIKPFESEASLRRIVPEVHIRQKALLYSDRWRVATVLSKLISNAIFFSDPEKKNPRLLVLGACSSEGCSLQIHDDGLGICSEEHANIFQAFYRLGTQSKGSGISLFIAKAITEKLNGTLTVNSQPGVGSVFSLWIPNRVSTRRLHSV